MKRFLLIPLILLIGAGAFAQIRSTEVGAVDVSRIGIDAAQQRIVEVSIDRFEREGFWRSSMSTDDGYVISRLFSGTPMGVQPIPQEVGLNVANDTVLGTRVDFLRRGYMDFVVYPQRPIPIEGITKEVSVWVAGRNYNHELWLMIEDFFGRPFELFMGRLNFQGWRRMSVAIPPQADDGFRGIVQRNYHYNNNMGIKIRGFRIVVDPWQAYGNYYLYFDELRAITDLFAEENRDPDDMVDGW